MSRTVPPDRTPPDRTPDDRLSPEVITKRDLGVPPTLDLAQHFRDLRSVALPVALVAVLLAAGVFVLRMNATPQYGATVLARVDSSVTDSAGNQTTVDNGAALQASYAEALADDTMLSTIVAKSNAPWTTRDAQSRISLAPGPASGLLQITALGDSSRQAATVAQETVSALANAVRTRRLQDAAQAATELRANAAKINTRLSGLAANDPLRPTLEVDYQAAINQITKAESAGLVNLAPLSSPTVSDTPVSPNPLRDALLAFLVALILLAELAVFARGRIGRRLRVVAARRIAQRHGAGVQQAAPGGRADAATIRTELLAARRLDAGADVLVLRGPQLPAGGGLNLGELRPPPGAGAPTGGTGRVVELEADGQWWRTAGLENVRLAVLVLAKGSRTKPLADRTLGALADTGIPAVLALLPKNFATRTAPAVTPQPASESSAGVAESADAPEVSDIPERSTAPVADTDGVNGAAVKESDAPAKTPTAKAATPKTADAGAGRRAGSVRSTR